MTGGWMPKKSSLREIPKVLTLNLTLGHTNQSGEKGWMVEKQNKNVKKEQKPPTHRENGGFNR